MADKNASEVLKWPTRKDVAIELGISLTRIKTLEEKGELTPVTASNGEKGRPSVHYDPDEVAILKNARKKKEEAAAAGNVPANDAEDDDDEGSRKSVTRELGAAQIIREIQSAMRQAQTHSQTLLDKNTQLIGQLEKVLTNLGDANLKVLMALSGENQTLRDRAKVLEEKTWTMLEAFQESLDRQHERALRTEDAIHGRRLKEEAFEKLFAYAPLLAALVGGKVAPGNPMPKEMALTAVVERMTPEQLEALARSGILDQAQLTTILAVKERLAKEEAERLRRKVADEEPDKNAEPETEGKGS